MGVKLTFRKDFECWGGAGKNMADLAPCTVDGEPIDDVLACTVESKVDSFPIMTIKVMVRETFADSVAVRLKK